MSKPFAYRFIIKDSSKNILFRGNAEECAKFINVGRAAIYSAASNNRNCNGYIIEIGKTEEMNPKITSGIKKIPDDLLQEWDEVCSKLRGVKDEQ